MALAADDTYLVSRQKVRISDDQSKLALVAKKNYPEVLGRSPKRSIARRVRNATSSSPFSFRQVVCIVGQSGQKKVEGSGFVIGKNGYILASRHQIEDARDLIAHFQDGSKYPAKLLSVSDTLDLALLQIPFQNVEPLLFDLKDVPQVGDPVIALGCPLGLNHSASQGIISAPERRLEGMRLLQTDVAINPGNSGGPLLNRSGRVIGVVVGVFQDARGISFALPSEEVRRFLGETFFKIGTFLAGENQNRAAIDALLMSSSFWFGSVQTHSNLGEVYRRVKKYESSESAFLNALFLDSQYANAHYNLGLLYGNNLNNQTKAALHYRKYLRLRPNSVDAAKVSRWLDVLEREQ